MIGTVKWFNRMKGHGFIVADGLAEDVFVHYSHIEDSELDGRRNLRDGDQVTFEPVDNPPKGLMATHVRVVR